MERFGFVRGLTNFCSRCTDAAGSTTQCGLNFVLKLVKVILLARCILGQAGASFKLQWICCRAAAYINCQS